MTKTFTGELEAVWTCGHRSRAMCAECYRILADNARQLAEENIELRAKLETLQRITQAQGHFE